MDQFLGLLCRLQLIPKPMHFDFGVEAVGDHVVHPNDAVSPDDLAGTHTHVAYIGARDVAFPDPRQLA